MVQNLFNKILVTMNHFNVNSVLLIIDLLLASCESITYGDLYIEWLREMSFTFRQCTSGWQNYGPIVWKWELTGPILVIELLQN